ncbi:MAG: response regulator [Planctomycetes bacterium]|nr:response regulator [Planctomycetota bacterium]
MTDPVLLVDDEPSILDGLRRQLRNRYQLETAVGPDAGLAVVLKQPFAVVVSDMRMPGMDGAHFLAEVRERQPECVRIMLTGQADIDAAIQAVNVGNLFRFLTKPCPAESLIAAIDAAIAQHRLLTAERELLEKTLSGSVRVLTEILSLTNPGAFGKAQRMRRVARRLADAVKHPSPWQVELAAMMSQLGIVTIPPDVVERADAGADLREDERQMLASIPEVTARLLANIPRLEPCARMIAAAGAAGIPSGEDPGARGARILRLMAEYEDMIASGRSAVSVLTDLRRQGYPLAAIEVLSSLDAEPAPKQHLTIPVRELRSGMVLQEDVRARNGVLLVPRGQELTHALLERILNFNRLVGVVEPIRVQAA